MNATDIPRVRYRIFAGPPEDIEMRVNTFLALKDPHWTVVQSQVSIADSDGKVTFVFTQQETR